MHSVSTPSEQQQLTSRRAMFRRRAVASVLTFSLMLQQGCYNSVPVAGATTMPAGTVIVNVNDRGRLLIGNRLGPLVDRVTGRVVRADSASVEMAVETAEDVRGNLARWGGERFTIPREGIGTIVEKKASKKRSFLLVGAIVVGVILLSIGARSIGKGGSNGNVDGEGNPI